MIFPPAYMTKKKREDEEPEEEKQELYYAQKKDELPRLMGICGDLDEEKAGELMYGMIALYESGIRRRIYNFRTGALFALNHAVNLKPAKGFANGKTTGVKFAGKRRFTWQIAAQGIRTIENSFPNDLVNFLVTRHCRLNAFIATRYALPCVVGMIDISPIQPFRVHAMT